MKNSLLLLIIFTYSFNSPIYCQNDNAEQLLKIAIKECKEGKLNNDSILLFKIQNIKIADNIVNDILNLEECLSNNELKDEIKKLCSRTITYLIDKFGEIDPRVFELNLVLAKTSYREGKIDIAKKYLDAANQTCNKTNNYSLGRLFKLSAEIDLKNGDVEKARAAFEKSIYYLIKTNKEKEIADSYYGLADAYSNQMEFDKALVYFDYASNLFLKLKEFKSYVSVLVTKSVGYRKIGAYSEAINCLNRAYFIGKIKLKKDDIIVVGILDRLANCYYFLNDYKNAIKYYSEYLDFILKNNIRTYYYPILKYKIGACYTNLKQFEKASLYIDSSLHLLHFNKNTPHPFDGLQSPVDMIMILYFKGKNYHKAYEAYGCEEDLHAAAEWYGLSVGLIEYLNRNYEEADSKQYLLDRFYYVFEAAINVFYTLHQETRKEIYADSMLNYMERSRAVLLKEAMQRAAAVNRAGIPDTLLKEERRLQNEIIALENERFEMLEGSARETSASLALASRLFDLKASRRQILSEIEKYHPAFYRNNYETRSLAIADVRRRLLRPDEMLLHYFIGDDYVLALGVSAAACRAVKFPIPDSLQQWVVRFREGVYEYAMHPSDSLARQYDYLGFRLYQSLLMPFGALPKRLLIAPDGLLEYLPFEAFLFEPVTTPDAFDQYPFLVRRHAIRYTHSLALLGQLDDHPPSARRRQVLAFAPSFERESASVDNPDERKRNLGILRDNIKEVEEIARIFPARIYTGSAATRERFVNAAGDYTVLHLATHAKANDDSGDFSYLAFASETADTATRLYVKDVYALHLHAEMVVLSACETGVGELRRGEGLISLARGFSYAGAGSLITTLWRVGDRPSYELMQRFYRQLKKHMYKDEALRLAQLEFIDAHPDLFSHPFFWAAFVPIGDVSPLQIGHDNHWRWWLVLAGLLGAVGYWTWQRKRRMAV